MFHEKGHNFGLFPKFKQKMKNKKIYWTSLKACLVEERYLGWRLIFVITWSVGNKIQGEEKRLLRKAKNFSYLYRFPTDEKKKKVISHKKMGKSDLEKGRPSLAVIHRGGISLIKAS